MGYADQIDLSDCGFVTRKTSLELDLDVTLVNFPISNYTQLTPARSTNI